jgi:hypothetical protein
MAVGSRTWRASGALELRLGGPRVTPDGVVERSFEPVKHEHPYREETEEGVAFVAEVRYFLDASNPIRPHDELGFDRPLEVHVRVPG